MVREPPRSGAAGLTAARPGADAPRAKCRIELGFQGVRLWVA